MREDGSKMKKQSLSEQVYIHLKERLFEMESGDFLSMRQCAKSMNISYTPVREAFLRLEEEQLLRRVPEIGYFVQKPDYLDFLSIFQVRKCIEPFILQQVFDRITPEDIRVLKDLNEQTHIAQITGNWESMLNLDIELHYVFVKKYKNKYLDDLYLSVRNSYRNILIKNLEFLGDSELKSRETYDHEPIIQAIVTQDADRAVQLLNEHIDDACARMTRRGIFTFLGHE